MKVPLGVHQRPPRIPRLPCICRLCCGCLSWHSVSWHWSSIVLRRPAPHPQLMWAPASSTCRALWHILILLQPENANFSRLSPFLPLKFSPASLCPACQQRVCVCVLENFNFGFLRPPPNLMQWQLLLSKTIYIFVKLYSFPGFLAFAVARGKFTYFCHFAGALVKCKVVLARVKFINPGRHRIFLVVLFKWRGTYKAA